MGPADDTSAHPISATTAARLREVLGGAFDAAVLALGEDTPPEVEVSTGRVDLPPPSPPEPGGVETSATRTAVGGEGQIVLHETTTRGGAGNEIRTTVALTGSSVDGERFWLGATSYAAGPIDRIELAGALPAFVAPVLGQVLTALRHGALG